MSCRHQLLRSVIAAAAAAAAALLTGWMARAVGARGDRTG